MKKSYTVFLFSPLLASPLKLCAVRCRRVLERSFLFFLLCLPSFGGVSGGLFAQTYYQVTTTSGVQSVGGINVNVSRVNISATQSPCGSAYGPYTTAPLNISAFPKSYKYVFSSPVSAIRAYLVQIDYDDTIRVLINGSQYFITSSNLSTLSGCSYGSIVPLAYNGMVVSTNPFNNNNIPSIQLDINTGAPIDSVEILEATYASGVDWGFYFNPCGPGGATINTPCMGDSLHLNALNLPGATANSYVWTGPNSWSDTTQYASIANMQASDTGSYYINATSSYCSYTDTVHVSMHTLPATPSASSNSPLCSGNSLTLTVNGPQAGMHYSWQGPNNFTDTIYNPTISNIQVIDSGYYSFRATDSNGCSSGDSLFVSIHQSPDTPHAASNSPVCAGSSLQFTVSNLQSGVSYSWTGPVSFTASIYNPARTNALTTYSGSYTVTAHLNSCAESGSTTAVVSPLTGPPLVNINAVPTNTICTGASAALSAIVSNGGSSPAYQWRKNTVNIAGATAATLTTSVVANGDVFSCEVTGNAACQPVDSALSNAVTEHVVQFPFPSISLAMNPPVYVSGSTETFTGYVTGSSAGLTYKWKKNGVIIVGANAAVYASSNLQPGDSICLIVYSSVPCTVPDSSVYCVQLETTGVTSPNLSKGEGLRVWPNPFSNQISVTGLEVGYRLCVYDIWGRKQTDIFEIKNALAEQSFSIEKLSPGIYFLRVWDEMGNTTTTLPIQKLK